MNVSVYRCYDADDTLIYVGCSQDVFMRMREHRSRKPWSKRVARVESDQYPSVEQARRAEAALIRALEPLANVQHRPRVPSDVLTHSPTDDVLAGVTEAAAILGWSRAKVKRAAISGELPHAMKMPGETGAYLFHRAVVEMVAKRTETAA